MSVVGIKVPPVSQEFIKALQAAFPLYEVQPGFDRDELMQSVGEQKVINWIVHKALHIKTVTGDPASIRQTMPTGAVVKVGT